MIKDLVNKIAHRKNKWLGLKGLSRSYYGMMLAHLGVGVTIVGIAMVSIYDEARDLRMDVGDQVTMGDYTFVFRGTSHITGPNFVSDQALIDVLKDGEPYSQMYPEKRVYNAQRSMMTEAAIDPGLFRDLYVALGEPLEGTAWAVRVQHKPFYTLDLARSDFHDGRWLIGGIRSSLSPKEAESENRQNLSARSTGCSLSREGDKS